MSDIIRVTEKQVVPSIGSTIRFPSLQFEIMTKELVYKEESQEDFIEKLSNSKNKEILNKDELENLSNIVSALKNSKPLNLDDKENLESLTRKLLGHKKKKKADKQLVEVSLKRRITATSKSIVIDTVKNDKDFIKNEKDLKGEHLKNTIKKIDLFINRTDVKELIYEYFNNPDIEERAEIVFQLGLIGHKNK
jgi:hypothetical protein